MPTEASIHPTALISPAANIGANVSIGPFCIIEDGVQVGDGCVIAGHAILRCGTTLGENVHVDSTAIIGGLPQDFGFDPATSSGVLIGVNTVIREGVTIHRSTLEGGVTRIGEAVFLMANSHVAHDCVVGDRAILANGVLLAGHVSIGSHAFLGGAAVFHQFVRVGETAMVSGGARVGSDVPPYLIAAERNQACGPNLVGLRRRGVPSEAIKEIKALFRLVFGDGVSARRIALDALKKGTAKTEQGVEFLKFFDHDSKRGYIQPPERTVRKLKANQ